MFITIKASKGKMLTDGETYAETISLCENKTPEGYYEISVEEYNEILKVQMPSEV